MAQTDRMTDKQTDRHTDGHGDSKTNSAKRAELVKMVSFKTIGAALLMQKQAFANQTFCCTE